MMRRFAPLLVLLLLLAACANETAGQSDDTAAPDATEEPTEDAAAADDLGAGVTVVTTVFPLADMAREIAPGADVTLLTSSGQDPHDLELTPQDRALIESADVVLYMGDIGFQAQVESAVEDASGTVISVADVAGSGNLRDFDGHSHDDGDDAHSDDDGHGHGDDDAHSDGDDDAHGDDDGHSDDDGHGHGDDDAHSDGDDDAHGHDEDGAVDPHLWFDAAIMAEVAEEIGEAIAAAGDEGAADAVRDSGEALHDELIALDEEIAVAFADCARDAVIVSHQAYAYLLEPHDLEQIGISGAGGHGDASPQRLAELTEQIRAEDLPVVLAEPVEGRTDAEALAAETGAELVDIDPLELGTDELFALGYVEALRQQAETFASAFECS
jgi:zinc transport system substrate-binding protein